MALQSNPPNAPSCSAFPLSIPLESFRPLIEEILGSVNDHFPGWPRGRVALEEREAAACIGVKPHVLRDARLQCKLAYTRVGRTVTYTADQLKAALDQMTVNH